MRQIAVISNPESTQNRLQMPLIRAELERARNAFHYEIGSIDDIPEALSRFALIDPLMIVVSGGDGTIQAVLSDLVYHRPFGDWPVPPIAILPSGKTNMIAADLNAPANAPLVLRKLLELAESGFIDEKVVRRHLIEMDMGDGKQPRIGMFFGGAAAINVINYTREKIYPMGLPNWASHVLTLARVATAVFKGPDKEGSPLQTRKMRINILGGGIIEGKYMAVIATTLDRLLLNMRPFSEAGRGGLKFMAMEHRPGPFFKGLWAIIRDTFGQRVVEGCHVRRADRIQLETTDPVTLDGELYIPVPGQPITLKGDRYLRFVRL